jgi:hypothetical protein
MDSRYTQKKLGTEIELCAISNNPQKHGVGKIFKILEINEGGWEKWSNKKYNDYIFLLECIN